MLSFIAVTVTSFVYNGQSLLLLLLTLRMVLFLIGWTLEIVADAQKTRFKADAANRGKFVGSGL